MTGLVVLEHQLLVLAADLFPQGHLAFIGFLGIELP